MTASRKDAREALAALLKPYLTSAQEIYAYQVSDFDRKSPVVYITSSGSRREKLTGRGFATVFTLNVHTFVLYPSENTGKGYSEKDAEDILDSLEHQIAGAILNIQGSPLIQSAAYAEPSDADGTVEVGGETYLHEIIPVAIYCIG